MQGGTDPRTDNLQPQTAVTVYHPRHALATQYGTDSERGLKRWRALRRTLLTEPGGVDRVIASLRYLARRRAPSVSSVVGYFINGLNPT